MTGLFEIALRVGAFAAVLGGMALWEVARPRRTIGGSRRERWPVNLGLGLLNALAVRIVAAGAVFGVAVYAAERGFGLLHAFPVPEVAGAVVTILALDLAVYLQHVLFHAVPVLWRLHRVHHADLGFDTTTGVRFHPIEILISLGLKSAVIVLLGGVPWAVVAFEILLSASSLFNHGNVAIPEGVDRRLRWLVVTPDMHRIHHSTRVVETNSNFGFSFSFWDRLCGTYRRDPALGQLGLEIGLSDYRSSLRFRELLLLPFRGSAGAYTFAGSLGDRIPPVELRDRLREPEPPIVLDVRDPAELGGPLGHIEGAVNVPVDELPERLRELEAWRSRLLVPV